MIDGIAYHVEHILGTYCRGTEEYRKHHSIEYKEYKAPRTYRQPPPLIRSFRRHTCTPQGIYCISSYHISIPLSSFSPSRVPPTTMLHQPSPRSRAEALPNNRQFLSPLPPLFRNAPGTVSSRRMTGREELGGGEQATCRYYIHTYMHACMRASMHVTKYIHGRGGENQKGASRLLISVCRQVELPFSLPPPLSFVDLFFFLIDIRSSSLFGKIRKRVEPFVFLFSFFLL